VDYQRKFLFGDRFEGFGQGTVGNIEVSSFANVLFDFFLEVVFWGLEEAKHAFDFRILPSDL
jgi:hypothetical protein